MRLQRATHGVKDTAAILQHIAALFTYPVIDAGKHASPAWRCHHQRTCIAPDHAPHMHLSGHTAVNCKAAVIDFLLRCKCASALPLALPMPPRKHALSLRARGCSQALSHSSAELLSTARGLRGSAGLSGTVEHAGSEAISSALLAARLFTRTHPCGVCLTISRQATQIQQRAEGDMRASPAEQLARNLSSYLQTFAQATAQALKRGG